MTTIQEIITKGQKKRHENHVKAGKNIKEKWKQEIIKDVEKLVQEYIDNNQFVCGNCNSDYIIGFDSFKLQLKQLEKKNNGN